jgi:predicted kinase
MGSLVVTGPPGAGKSTVARLVAESHERGVHLDSDAFWFMIRSGYVAPWEPEANPQNGVVLEAVSRAAAAFDRGGYEVVIDGIIGPWFLDRVRAVYAEAGLPLDYVILRPPENVLLQRAAERAGQPPIAEDRIRQMQAAFSRLDEWESHVVPNDAVAPGETVTQISALRRTGALRV